MSEILAQMSEKFIETAHEKIARLNEILVLLSRSNEDEKSLLEEFHREVHSLKGMGGTFQMPLVSKLCHKFEDFLSGEKKSSDGLIGDCYAYLDRLNDLIESGQAGDLEKIEIWLANLPQKGTVAEPHSESKRNKVLIISSSPEMVNEITPLFQDNGFTVTSASSAFRGYKAAVLHKPDVVLSAQVQDEMDGAELIRSLGSLQALSQTKFAMICPDRRQALSENLQGVQLLSEANVAIDVMNFIAVVVTA
ncbi:MAG: Hpt domain-containing protein [Terasakiella sp.]|uniref:Hpt domain-containing protein n=1 Tax=unclassified Terasakiella TaxID=2614952 RepID=UPI003B00AE35